MPRPLLLPCDGAGRTISGEITLQRRVRGLRSLMTIGALLLTAAAVQAQTTGNSNTGQQLFTTTLTPPCESCHSTTNDADPRSLKSHPRQDHRARNPGRRGQHDELRQSAGSVRPGIDRDEPRWGRHRHERFLHAGHDAACRPRRVHRRPCRPDADPALCARQRADLPGDRGRCDRESRPSRSPMSARGIS